MFGNFRCYNEGGQEKNVQEKLIMNGEETRSVDRINNFIVMNRNCEEKCYQVQ